MVRVSWRTIQNWPGATAVLIQAGATRMGEALFRHLLTTGGDQIVYEA